jgi:hypothetical protein
MRSIIKKILREEIKKRYNKVTPELYSIIMKYIKLVFKRYTLDHYTEDQTYGDYRVEFCSNGKEIGLFMGTDKDVEILIDDKIINEVSKYFKIRKGLVVEMISDYIEETYLDDFNSRSKLSLTDVDRVAPYNFKGGLCKSEIQKKIPNYNREQKIEWFKSVGRTMAYIDGENIPIVDLTDEQLNKYFDTIWIIEFQQNYTYDIEEYDDEEDY